MKGISPGIRRLAKMTPVIIVLAAVTLFVTTDIIDLANQDYPAGFLRTVVELDPSTAPFTLTAMACALGTLAAITITLVLIVVQLTANRYTPKLIDLFLEAKVNLLLLAMFLFSIVYCFYVAHTIKPDFVPAVGGLLCVGLMTLCLTSLIPYLFFVLDFMEPNNIISKIESRAIACLQHDSPRMIAGRKAKLRFSQSLEQIADIAKGSLRINDSSVALSSVWALRDISVGYLKDKSQRPGQWFKVERGTFLGPSVEYVRRMEQDHNWVEVGAPRATNHIRRGSGRACRGGHGRGGQRQANRGEGFGQPGRGGSPTRREILQYFPA